MNRKLVIIIAAVLVVAIAGVAAVFLLGRGSEAEEEAQFLPTGWQGEPDGSNNSVGSGGPKTGELTIYFEAQDNTVSGDVLKAVNRKMKEDIDTTLSFQFVYDYPVNYLEKIRQDIAAGLPCDAFFYSSWFPVSLETLAKEESIMDLTDLFPRLAHRYYGQFSAHDIDAISVNDRIYAIPARLPTADRKCVIVRQDLMEKYHIPEIRNFDDYEVYLSTVQQNEPNMVPMNYWDTSLGVFSDASGYVTLDYEMGLVYKWDDSKVKVEAWEQTPVFMESMKRIKGWYDKKYLTQNVGIAEMDEFMITNGNWASFIANYGDHLRFNAFVRSKGIKDWSYSTYPLHDGYSARMSPLENGLVISSKSKNADRVLMFIDWLQSKQENYDLLMYGIEGTNYVQKGDYIEPPQGTEMKDSFFSWSWKAPFTNIEYERVNYPGLKQEVQRYNDVIVSKSKYPPHMGFYPDYSTVSDLETLRRMAFSELDRKIYMGIFEQQDIDEYIKEQQDNGIDNLVAEVQKQLDEYLLSH